jgi:hypothetical protein
MNKDLLTYYLINMEKPNLKYLHLSIKYHKKGQCHIGNI